MPQGKIFTEGSWYNKQNLPMLTMPTSPQPDPAITRLLTAVQAWEHEESSDTCFGLEHAYLNLLRRRELTRRKELTRYAIDYLLLVCRACASVVGDLDLQISNKMLTLLANEKNWQSLSLASNGDEAMLAWFCCDHAITHTANGNSKYRSKFIKFLSMWRGRPFPTKTLPEIDKVANFLYGPGCWDLYGYPLSDDLDDCALATITANGAIWSANLPLLEPASQTQTDASAIEIPGDLV